MGFRTTVGGQTYGSDSVATCSPAPVRSRAQLTGVASASAEDQVVPYEFDEVTRLISSW